MRRILMVFAAMAVMVAMMVASAMPAFATKPPTKSPATGNGQYYCYDNTNYILPDVGPVPQGQTAKYEQEGYSCYRGG